MKNLIIIFAFLFSGVAFSQIPYKRPQAKKVTKDRNVIKTNKSVIELKETSVDFGTIPPGVKVEHNFSFENTGTEPLLINSVLTGCGCTATEFTREPIPPGESGVIVVQFNSEGKVGKQYKAITVNSNASNGSQKIYIGCMVAEPSENKGNKEKKAIKEE